MSILGCLKEIKKNKQENIELAKDMKEHNDTGQGVLIAINEAQISNDWTYVIVASIFYIVLILLGIKIIVEAL